MEELNLERKSIIVNRLSYHVLSRAGDKAMGLKPSDEFQRNCYFLTTFCALRIGIGIFETLLLRDGNIVLQRTVSSLCPHASHHRRNTVLQGHVIFRSKSNASAENIDNALPSKNHHIHYCAPSTKKIVSTWRCAASAFTIGAPDGTTGAFKRYDKSDRTG